MSDKTSKPQQPFPTPNLARSAEKEGLDLQGLDMSYEDRQGNAVVTKGTSATFVTTV